MGLSSVFYKLKVKRKLHLLFNLLKILKKIQIILLTTDPVFSSELNVVLLLIAIPS